MRAAALFALAIGCDAAAPRVVPIIEAPPSGSDGYPWDGVTDLVLSIARAGDGQDLAVARGAPGESLDLAGVDFADDLVLHLSGRESELEVAYGRSCAFAVAEDAEPESPRLYFARVVRWAAAPPPSSAGAAWSGYATPDGAAVAFGASSSVERFDPRVGAFEVIESEPPLLARSDAAMAVLPDGRAVRLGGALPSGATTPVIELIDPRSGVAAVDAQEGPEAIAVVDATATTLVDGDVIVAGGRPLAAGAEGEPRASATLLRFGAGGALELVSAIDPGLTRPRAGHSATRLGDEVGADVLVIGGRAADGSAVGDAELYRPLAAEFEAIDGAALVTPRWGHVAVRLPGGFVRVAGGFTAAAGAEPVAVDTIELYDPLQGRFTAAGVRPAGAGRSGIGVASLPDGRVLLAGGRDPDGQPVDASLIAAFDPVSGEITISPTDRMDAARAAPALVRLCDGTILAIGGTEPGGPIAERYDPPSTARR